MPSTLACLGLAVDSADDLADLLDRLEAEDHGRGDGVRILRHVDESAARVVVGVRDGEVLDLVPSCAAPVGALLGGLQQVGDHVAADVLDADSGEVVTRLLCDLEQRRCLPGPNARHAVPGGVQWPASVVALGVDVAVHDDAAAYAASQDGGAARFAEESFVSFGLFRDGEGEPTAHLAGTVLEVETRTTAATGQDFHAAQVRTAGFTATVCLAGDAAAPAPGQVLAGTCWMVADVPALWSLDVGSLHDLAPSPRRGRRRRGLRRRGDAPA